MIVLDELKRFYSNTIGKTRFADWDECIQVLKQVEHADGTEEVRLRFFTYLNEYVIVAKFTPDTRIEPCHDYLGASTMARKAKAGEDHRRGRDLPDGRFDGHTWEKIISAILAYEIGPLYRGRHLRPVVGAAYAEKAADDKN